MTLRLDESAILWSTPEAERAGKPLLVLLHGLGSHEGDLFGLAPYLPLEFALASVRAPHVAEPGFAWFPRDPERPGDPLPAIADESADALIAWLRSLPAHPSIGLLGFSQGGAIATHVLRRAPKAADYAVVLSGFSISGEQEGDPALAELRPPVFLGIGEADPVIPAAAFGRLAAWAEEHTEVETRTYPGLTHTISGEELDDVNRFLRKRLTAPPVE